MSTKQDEVKNQVVVIDLWDFISSIWKQRLLIIICIIVCALLSGIYSEFFISPKYQSRFTMMINMPDTYESEYGTYNMKITANEDYMKFFTNQDVLLNTMKDMGYDPKNIEEIKNCITLGKMNTNLQFQQNVFDVSVTKDNASEAQKLATTLYANYLEYIDIMVKNDIATYFTNTYNAEIGRIENENKIKEKDINFDKELLNSISLYRESGISNNNIIFNAIDTNYLQIEGEIIALKKEIYKSEENLVLYKDYKTKLEKENLLLSKYATDGDYSEISNDEHSIVRASFSLILEPTLPSSESSPNKTRNIIYGIVIGGMLGVLISVLKFASKYFLPLSFGTKKMK